MEPGFETPSKHARIARVLRVPPSLGPQPMVRILLAVALVAAAVATAVLLAGPRRLPGVQVEASASSLPDSGAGIPLRSPGNDESRPLVEAPRTARKPVNRKGGVPRRVRRKRDGPTRLELRLVSAADGSPLKSFVSLQSEDVFSDPYRAATDSDGRVEFELPAGETLWASFDEHLAPHSQDTNDRGALRILPLAALESRFEEVALNLVLLPLRGQVLAKDGAVPIQGAGIRVKSLETVFETGAMGIFSGEVPRGTHKLRVTAPGFVVEELRVYRKELEAGEHLEVLLERAAELLVQVVGPRGEPADRARVRLGNPGRRLGAFSFKDPREWADASGLCRIDGIEPGVPFVLEVLWDGSRQRYPELLEFEPGEEAEVRFELRREIELVGIVVDERGEPVKGRLECFPASRFEDSYATELEDPFVVESSDEDGRFRFRHLLPGLYWIRPRTTAFYRHFEDREIGGEPYRLVSLDTAPLARAVSIPRDVESCEIELSVHRGVPIRGHVMDPHGNPASATVEARSIELEGTWSQRTFRGSFDLGPFAPGEFEVIARSSSGQFGDSAPQRVQAGDRRVRLVLAP